ncbi:MAG: LysR family transcriptional regulator [Clostridia bacterium]|nr:LysR family transcriptional regulator [Clostridia bacterium]
MFRNKDVVLAVYREGSFSRAAEKLYVSQPSLSATVKRIENKLSVPIFDRTTTPVTLTPIGREYIRYCMMIEEQENSFSRYLSDQVNLLAGEIRIGGSSLFSSFMLPRMISEFSRLYPQISFQIFEDSTKNLMKGLLAGNLDIILDNAIIRDENILSTVYTEELLLLAVPSSFEINRELAPFSFSGEDIKKGSHLHSDKTVELGAFSRYPFILLHAENDTGKRAESLFKKHQLQPDIAFRLDQQVTAYNISSSGMGICFVSDTLIRHSENSPSLCFYRLSDPEICRNIYFYQKNKRYLSLAGQRFVEHNTSKFSPTEK